MNKRELLNAVADRAGMAQKNVKGIVEATFDVIAEALVNGEQVKVQEFGTFLTMQSKARNHRNMFTGEEFMVPEKRYPKFRASKVLKERVED